MRVYHSPFRIIEIHFDSMDSTQSYAKKHWESFAPDAITCVIAETQTGGYGRQKRAWLSPKGAGLYATLVFRLPASSNFLSCLAILLARSLASLLKQGGVEPHIKWPNDVQINGKKIAGILCETQEKENWVQVFLGIGININTGQEDLATIDQPATSLLLETGRLWDRKVFFQTLVKQFASDLSKYTNRNK